MLSRNGNKNDGENKYFNTTYFKTFEMFQNFDKDLFTNALIWTRAWMPVVKIFILIQEYNMYEEPEVPQTKQSSVI